MPPLPLLSSTKWLSWDGVVEERMESRWEEEDHDKRKKGWEGKEGTSGDRRRAQGQVNE